MAKILFLFTGNYPYSNGETFIENEISILSAAFDQIVIVSNNLTGEQTRTVPDNIKLERMPYELSAIQKIYSLGGLFTATVWKELILTRNYYKLSLTKLIVNTVLQSFYKSHLFKRRIGSLINTYATEQDEVYLYGYWSNDSALGIARLHPSKRIKQRICRAHGWDVYFEANKAQYLPFRKFLLDTIDRQLFISDAGKDYYLRLFPNMRHKMAVARLGVNAQSCRSPDKSRERFVVVTCSNIIAIKRVHLVVEALSLIDTQQVEWHHFGDGPLSASVAESCAELLNNRANISYKMHGRVTNQAFLHFITHNPVHVFVNVSSSEGIPVSIMEAMSAGIPCIATAVGGTPELVNKDNGILLEQNPQPQYITDALMTMISLNEKEYTSMKQKAFEIWENTYNADRNYRQFVQEYLN